MNYENTDAVAYKDAADFDAHLFSNIDNMLEQMKGVANVVNILRCKGMLTDDEKVMRWNYEQVYANADVVALSLSLVSQGEIIEDLKSDDPEVSDSAQDTISLTTHLLPTQKLKNIVHLPKLSADKDAINISTTKLLELPQWCVVFNLMDHDLTFADRKVAGISFLREEDSVKNNEPVQSLSFLIIFADGKMDLGLKLAIEKGETVAQYLNRISKQMRASIDALPGAPQEILDTFINHSKDTVKFYEHAFTYLAYFLNNLDKVKDSSGNVVPFPSNPGTVLLDPEDPHELHEDAETVTIYHLD